MILEGYGAGPWMIQLIRGSWQDAILVCHAAGNYGTAFKAGRGITQGGPLSTKLFNILVDAMVRKWVQQLKEDGNYKEVNWQRQQPPSLQFSTLRTRTLHHGMQVFYNTR
jgi:hypothetical protein